MKNLINFNSFINENVIHIIDKSDFERFLSINNIRKILNNDKYDLYLSKSIDPDATYDPKYSKLEYKKGSEFSEICKNFVFSRV